MGGNSQAGFTLLEVLVAVAILALTMGAFISGSSRYADDARYIQDKTMALWVARNKLVELQLADPWPDEGRDQGTKKMGGREWEWRSEVTKSPDPRVRRVEVRVFHIKKGSQLGKSEDSIASLTGFLSPKSGKVEGTIDRDALKQLQNQGLTP